MDQHVQPNKSHIVRRWRVVGLAALLLTASHGSSAAADRQVASPYQLGGVGDVAVTCDGAAGGSCFDLIGDELRADITVQDDAEWMVGALYQWRTLKGRVDVISYYGVAEYEVIGEGHLCGPSARVDVPPLAEELVIYLGVVSAVRHCGVDGFGPATEGVISVTFQLPDEVSSTEW